LLPPVGLLFLQINEDQSYLLLVLYVYSIVFFGWNCDLGLSWSLVSFFVLNYSFCLLKIRCASADNYVKMLISNELDKQYPGTFNLQQTKIGSRNRFPQGTYID